MEPTLADSFLGEFRSLHLCGLSEAGSVSMSSPNCFNQSRWVVRNLDSPIKNEPLFSFPKLHRAGFIDAWHQHLSWVQNFLFLKKKKKSVCVCIYIYIYCQCWVFIAAHGLSPVAASGATLIAGQRLLVAVAPLVVEHRLQDVQSSSAVSFGL